MLVRSLSYSYIGGAFHCCFMAASSQGDGFLHLLSLRRSLLMSCTFMITTVTTGILQSPGGWVNGGQRKIGLHYMVQGQRHIRKTCSMDAKAIVSPKHTTSWRRE